MAKQKKEYVDYNEEYNSDVQRMYLNYLLSDATTFARVRSILREEYFHSTVRAALRFMLKYADENHALPSVEQVVAKTGVPVEKFSEPEEPEHAKWFMEQVEAFCRYKALENIIYAGPDYLALGQGAEIEKRVKEAMTISLMSDLGTDCFEDPAATIRRLKDRSNYVSTGWSDLDYKLYGGFTRGALNIFAGGSGSGKSLFLQNIALNWIRAGMNVVYISLELSEDLIKTRLYSMSAGRSTTDIFRDPEGAAQTIAAQGDWQRRLRIKRLPEGGTTVNDIRAYLKEYQIKTGSKPDAVIVDYLDLLYPVSGRVDAGDHFSKDKFTSEELRGLAHEYNLLCVTASQLNRGAVGADGEFDHSHIAGGISKINTADNVFAIHTNMRMREAGTYELKFLKTRSSAAVGQKIELAFDSDSMRITDAPKKPEIAPKAKASDLLRAHMRTAQRPIPGGSVRTGTAPTPGM